MDGDQSIISSGGKVVEWKRRYWKNLAVGSVMFLIYWIALPIFVVALGGWIYPRPIPGWLEGFGKILAGLGFAFGMVSASYMVIDGGGGPMFCCPPKKLVTCGTFSMCRHPVYLGFMVYLLGLSLEHGRLGSILLSGVFSALIVLWSLTFEERGLRRRFPEYEDYAKEVSSFLPRLPKRSDTCPPLLFMLLFYVGHVISWFTWNIEVEKRCDPPEGGYVVLANHVTYLDFAVVVYAISRFINFPVSAFHYESNSWFYKSVGCFPISRLRPDARAIMKILSLVKKGGRVGIFPEAERSWDGRFLGFKRGFDKLLSKMPRPLVGVRIEEAHLRFPRWGRFFYPGRVKVVLDCFDDPDELERFLSKPSVPEDGTYNSYEGVENYIYACPSCGKIGSIRSFKEGFKCLECGFERIRPTVGELWKMHDSLLERVDLPYTEEAQVVSRYGKPTGERVEVTFREDGLEYLGRFIPKESFVSFIVEGRHEVFLYDGERVHGFRFEKSALLWNDLIKKYWNL